jgi:hypothetical protein
LNTIIKNSLNIATAKALQTQDGEKALSEYRKALRPDMRDTTLTVPGMFATSLSI